MLSYERTDIREGTDHPKNNNSKECMICHYWFLNHAIKFQHSICNDCRMLTLLSVNISDTAIITLKDVDYSCIINDISKSEAINLLKIYVLDDRGYI